MITEDYVSFETAKLLREKGFEEVCSAYYEDFEKKQSLYMCYKRGNYNIVFKQREDLENRFNLPKERYKCAAPTLQMAMKWLRKIHHIHIRLINSIDESYRYEIYPREGKYRSKCFTDSCYYETYEQACEVAIKYCLDNLI